MLIEQFICREDNFAVILHDEVTAKTLAIDAPDGAKMLTFLSQRGWGLDAVLITHHHRDHTEGIGLLKWETGAHIIGPAQEADKIAGLDAILREGEQYFLGDHVIEAMATPGHTAGALSYHMPRDKVVFTGDTLFSLGCGRLFECPAEIMFNSLKKLRNLPLETQIYCGHEYTQSNGRFAVSVDRDNADLQARINQVEELSVQGHASLPTTLASELRTNPFLRYDNVNIRAYLQLDDSEDVTVFARLRQLKDNF